MRYSQLLIPTIKPSQQDKTDSISIHYLICAGMVRKLCSGIYEWLPVGLRMLRRVEAIVREEMDKIGGQEVCLPIIQPKHLWTQTDRWDKYGDELLRIQDRKKADFCFSPTAEEMVTDLVKRSVDSYKDLPLMLYQINTKFRDEIRPRFGIIRAREFLMKDAYSFHIDKKDMQYYYQKVLSAYECIFNRCGLNFKVVEAQSGTIGGSISHEFMVLADTGESTIAICTLCDYASNIEKIRCVSKGFDTSDNEQHWDTLQEVHTPNKKSIQEVSQFLKQEKSQTIKSLFYRIDDLWVVFLLRGDTYLNEHKLQILYPNSKKIRKMTLEEYRTMTNCSEGYGGPVGLSQISGLKGIKINIVADFLIGGMINAISGANKEDTHLSGVNMNRDFCPHQFADIRYTLEGDSCPVCACLEKQGTLKFYKGIEVGHAFQLGTRYSENLKAYYKDHKGHSVAFEMGTYGIGVSRIIAASIEQQSDDKGMILHHNIAPFQVFLILIDMRDEVLKGVCEDIYQDLCKKYNVLYDDRQDRIGIKFHDADLLGIPIRIVISKKLYMSNKVELKIRSSHEIIYCDLSDYSAVIAKHFKN